MLLNFLLRYILISTICEINKGYCIDFQSFQTLAQRERDLKYYLLQINYMRSQVRTGSSKSVEKRAMANMPK